MQTRFFLQTYGCRVNQYESQAIREQLLNAGLQETPTRSAADVVVINSCSVTERSDLECFSDVRAIHRNNPGTKIVVAGCLVQRDADRLKSLPGVRLLVGTGQKHRIAEFVQELVGSDPGGYDPTVWEQTPRLQLELDRVYAPLKISEFQGMCKAFVKIQDGCDRACAFCKIPYVRGRSRTRPLTPIIEEARRLMESGYKELILTGVAIGLWGKELEPPLELGEAVLAVSGLPGKFRIRLSSLDPRDLDDRLIEALASAANVCRHLHLSLQSGSDKVLERMNRNYTVSEYRARVEKVRRFWPDLGLTTDVIVGFPGETEADFEETLKFCRQMRFARIHVFPYSRRPHTAARLFKDPVDRLEIKRRARLLREEAAEIAASFAAQWQGTCQEVLLEQMEPGKKEQFLGYSTQYLQVSADVPGGRIGDLAVVRIVGLEGAVLRGKISF